MFFNTEVAFVDEFIACLKINGINQIPFDNCQFYDGVDRMATFFKNNESKLGDVADELSMLFIKNPFECVYSRFRNVISNRNGHCLSFINPDYVKSLSALSDKDAEYTLKKARSGVPRKFMEDCTNEFCEGAQIKKTDDK